MIFGKLVLAAVFSCVPLMALAVEPLDDERLSATVGREDILIAIDLDMTTDIVLHDTDGISAAFQPGYGYAGAIVSQGLSIVATNGTPNVADGMLIKISSGDGEALVPTLVIDVLLPGAVAIETGALSVANSRRDSCEADIRGVEGELGAPWMDSAEILLSAGAEAHVELAHEDAGAGIELHARFIEGIVISNVALHDINSGGSIGFRQLSISDADGNDLTLRAKLRITEDAAIAIALAQIGGASAGMNLHLSDVYLGALATGQLGDLDVLGFNMNGTTVTVSGRSSSL